MLMPVFSMNKLGQTMCYNVLFSRIILFNDLLLQLNVVILILFLVHHLVSILSTLSILARVPKNFGLGITENDYNTYAPLLHSTRLSLLVNVLHAVAMRGVFNIVFKHLKYITCSYYSGFWFQRTFPERNAHHKEGKPESPWTLFNQSYTPIRLTICFKFRVWEGFELGVGCVFFQTIFSVWWECLDILYLVIPMF